jgi:hypothetical protein
VVKGSSGFWEITNNCGLAMVTRSEVPNRPAKDEYGTKVIRMIDTHEQNRKVTLQEPGSTDRQQQQS